MTFRNQIEPIAAAHIISPIPLQIPPQGSRIIAAIMTDEPYVPGSEQDIRNVMKLLVDSIKLWQVRAVTADKILKAILAAPPQKRASLSVADIDALVRDIRPQAGAAADLWAEQVEKKLEEGDFLNAARLYASQQFWKGSGL